MSDLQWKTEERYLKSLKDFEKNPRQMSAETFARLQESLDKFNYTELIVCDQDNTILSGHMRVRAIRKLHGNKGKILVRVPNRPLTEKERDEYVIIANKIKGDFDYDILANEWDMDELFNMGFTLEEFNIDMKEIPEKKEKKKKVCPHCGEEF